MQNESISLHCQEGGSDKLYNVELLMQDGAWVVNFSYGARGKALKTGTKTPYPIVYNLAKKAYDSLVKSKKSGGYLEIGELGESINTLSEKIDSGIRPQLLNEISLEEALDFIYNDSYCAQQKFDGERRMIRKKMVDVTGINKKGMIVPLPFGAIAEACFIAADFVMDGEAIGETIMIFDNLTEQWQSIPYQKRFNALQLLLSDPNGDMSLKLVETAWSTKEKQALFNRLISEKAEGIVFKNINAPYTAGRPSKGGDQYKCKFYETASCIVASVSDIKSSIALEVYDEKGMPTPIGNVTVYANQTTPSVGDIVEVRYLYYYPGGSLYQPVLLGDVPTRTDVDPNECLLSKLKEKQNAEN